jgi:hypothetical protein
MGVVTALAIGSIAASAYGAHKAASASEKASGLQADSANRALDLQRNIYNQQQQMQAPYMGLGNSAAMTLGRLMGAPAGSQFASAGLGPGAGLPMKPGAAGMMSAMQPYADANGIVRAGGSQGRNGSWMPMDPNVGPSIARAPGAGIPFMSRAGVPVGSGVPLGRLSMWNPDQQE